MSKCSRRVARWESVPKILFTHVFHEKFHCQHTVVVKLWNILVLFLVQIQSFVKKRHNSYFWYAGVEIRCCFIRIFFFLVSRFTIIMRWGECVRKVTWEIFEMFIKETMNSSLLILYLGEISQMGREGLGLKLTIILLIVLHSANGIK